MPELPEVTIVIETLKKHILNKRIKKVEVLLDKIIKNTSPNVFIRTLENQRFLNIYRKGKNIIFYTELLYLVVHLRMEGKFYYFNNKKELIKSDHTLVRIYFFDNSILEYIDSRRFGTFHLYSINKYKDYNKIPQLKNVGYEPWDSKINSVYLFNHLNNKKTSIKNILLSQKYISGIGNIYADEILFKSKIHPLTPCNKITLEKWELIYKNTKYILEKAIELGGSSIKSFKSNHNISGKFQNELYVYGRNNQKCLLCFNKILKIKHCGRGTHYCDKCQK